MSEPPTDGRSNNEDGDAITVSVSSNGQATIPKVFREKIGVDAPGRVQFRETDDGTIVVERVRSVEEMRGFAARAGDPGTEKSATELLREKRKREKRERE